MLLCFIFTDSGFRKKLEAAAKKKDCSLIREWQRSIINYLYGGPEGHSPVDGSRMRTPTIDQSTVDGWTFKPLIIEQQVHSDDRRSMIGHSSHQPLTIEQQVHSDDRRSMIGHSNHQPLTIEQQVHFDDQRSMVGHSNHQPLTIEQHAYSDDQRSMVGFSNHQPLTIEQHAHSDDRLTIEWEWLPKSLQMTWIYCVNIARLKTAWFSQNLHSRYQSRLPSFEVKKRHSGVFASTKASRKIELS